MATQNDLKTYEIMTKLTEGILGAKTFADIPKWQVEGGPVPRTFFSDRLNRNPDKPINGEAVFWLIKLYDAQLGIFKMQNPMDDAKSVKIANDLEQYLSDITSVDLSQLKNTINDSDSKVKRQCLINILASVLDSTIDKEEFEPDIVTDDVCRFLQNIVLGGDFDSELKTLCITEVSGKCPFCKHELIGIMGDNTVGTYRILKFLAAGHVERYEYLAVCNNCYEQYKFTSDDSVLQRLRDKKEAILSKRSFEKAVDALEMEKEIEYVLNALFVTDPDNLPELNYKPVAVIEKIPDNNMLRSKIKAYVVQYFPFVEEKLRELNNEKKLTYEKISGDVKRAYLEFASNETSKEVIFCQLCDWLANKTQTDKKSACEVIISYYVQNCEVFERETAE